MAKNVKTNPGMARGGHPTRPASRDFPTELPAFMRSTAPKSGTAGNVPAHSGMRSRIRHEGGMADLTGMSETSLREAQAPMMDTKAPGKRLTPPTVAPGMRSRVNEVHVGDRGHVPNLQALGRAVLASAIQSGSTKLSDTCDDDLDIDDEDDPFDFGRGRK
jgi:hypothetical protein